MYLDTRTHTHQHIYLIWYESISGWLTSCLGCMCREIDTAANKFFTNWDREHLTFTLQVSHHYICMYLGIYIYIYIYIYIVYLGQNICARICSLHTYSHNAHTHCSFTSRTKQHLAWTCHLRQPPPPTQCQQARLSPLQCRALFPLRHPSNQSLILVLLTSNHVTLVRRTFRTALRHVSPHAMRCSNNQGALYRK